MNDIHGARMVTLLTAVADALDDGQTPLSHDFLVEHDVTLSECHSLVGNLAAIVRGYLRSVPPIRIGVYLAGIADEKEGTRLGEVALLATLQSHYLQQIPDVGRPPQSEGNSIGD